MRQLLSILVVYVCIRCLACGVQGQIRECASGEPRCLDIDLRLQIERPPASPGRYYGAERWEVPSPWPEEPWQLGHRREPRAPAPWQLRKRPRGLQIASDVNLSAHRSTY